MKRFAVRLAPLAVSLGLLTACGGGGAPTVTPAETLQAPMATAAGVATISGKRNNYTIAKTATGWSVTAKSGGAVTAVAGDSTSIAFTDYTVNLGIGAQAATLTEADLQLLVELYIAFFNRVPDADGLAYWIGRFKAGMSIDAIADNFYAAAVQYSSVTGYSADMTNADFVRIVYKNVLGRTGSTAPPDADVDYWAARLANKSDTRGSLIRVMLYSAHTFKGDATWGKVANLLDNKFSVGFFFAVQQGLNFTSTSDNVTRGATIASFVTATSTSSARTLIGVTDASFTQLTLVPTAPTLVSATAGEAKATVSFSAPAFDGGTSVTGYSASCTGGGGTQTASGTSSPIVVSGLAGGTTYACSAAAKNAIGTGASSAAVSVTTPGSNATGIYGFLTDGVVKGVKFVCSPSQTTGTTDALGRYQCATNDASAAFSIDAGNGSINIGSAVLPAFTGLPLFVALLEVDGTAVGLKTAEILHALDHSASSYMDVSSIVLPANVIQQANAFIANPNAPPTGFPDDDIFLAHVQAQAKLNSNPNLNLKYTVNGLGGGQAFIQDVVLPHVADTMVKVAATLPRPVVRPNGSTRLAGTVGISGSAHVSQGGATATVTWQGGGVTNMIVQGDITQPGTYAVTYSTPGQAVRVHVSAAAGDETFEQSFAVNTGRVEGTGTITVGDGFGGHALTLPTDVQLPPECAGSRQFAGTDVGLSNPMITMSMPLTCTYNGVTVSVNVTMKLVGAP